MLITNVCRPVWWTCSVVYVPDADCFNDIPVEHETEAQFHSDLEVITIQTQTLHVNYSMYVFAIASVYSSQLLEAVHLTLETEHELW